MADIELLIKIPEDEYNIAKYGQYGNINVDIVRKAIANGTPLPKGHGRLIDADALIDTLGCSDEDIYVKACIEEDAPTIIEADMEESGDKE
jgi:hypothetical protein